MPSSLGIKGLDRNKSVSAIKSVDLLLKINLNLINITVNHGDTGLYSAVYKSQMRIVTILLPKLDLKAIGKVNGYVDTAYFKTVM